MISPKNFGWAGGTCSREENSVSDLITSGLPTVGIRIPKSNVAREFIQHLTSRWRASANLFKIIQPAPNMCRTCFHQMMSLCLMMGREVGIESTIIKVNKGSLEILRPGLVSGSELQEIASKHGFNTVYTNNTDVRAPGMLEEHYMPTKPLQVVCSDSFDQAKEKYQNIETYWFTLSDRPEMAARELYQKMREACEMNHPDCSLWLNSNHLNDELWKGIIDRLKKASTRFIK